MLIASTYPGAGDVRVHDVQEHGVSAVTYTVRLGYPARPVMEHYRVRLENRGWQRTAGPDGHGEWGEWSCFEDGTRKGTPLVHQMLADWENGQTAEAALLTLRYYSYGGRPDCKQAPDNDLLHVSLQIMPTDLVRRGSPSPPSGR